ncbi:LysR substrate-binding domain-containing protein [Pseudoroseomonas sp. WGS1072]|uniref:LysR substrate-binding domain-containing protein n=1 Tax=Roseomonas sp. WGS1072 TaxID=3366816 RepID=UPI003BF2A9EE
MIIQAPVAGLGLALVPRAIVKEELDAGTLVSLFGRSFASGSGYHVVFPGGAQNDAKVQHFHDWLHLEPARGKVKAAPSPGQGISPVRPGEGPTWMSGKRTRYAAEGLRAAFSGKAATQEDGRGRGTTRHDRAASGPLHRHARLRLTGPCRVGKTA